MQALVLAGGEGTRLRPLTYTVPKPVLPLVGRPHIAYVIDWLVRHGVDDVIVSCGHLAEGMRQAVAAVEPGVRIRYAEEPDARGTAGAIRFAEDMLADRFLVLNGDVLCDLDLTALISQHNDTGAQATIALYPVSDPTGYGLVHRKDDGEITEFLEKPEPDQIDTDEINAGAYLLERSVLDFIAPDRAVSIEREVFPKLIGEGLYGIRLEGYWIDIGTPARFLEANWDILEGRVETVISDQLERYSRSPRKGQTGGSSASPAEPPRVTGGGALVWVGDGSEVSPEAQLREPCVVGRNCRIGAGAVIDRSVLLDGCVVEESATISESILSGAVTVSGGAQLDGEVIGEGETVPAGVVG
jgi:mannose-1-phosphate guanylyltransferase